MGRFHNFVFAAVSDEAGASEFADRVSDLFLGPLVLWVASDPQDQLGDREMQLHDLGESRLFIFSGH